MLKKYNRLMLAIFGLTDIAITIVALALAYLIRFQSDLFTNYVPVELGVPPFSDFINFEVCLSIAITWLLVFKINGLYEPRRGRQRLDEVFSVVWSVIISSLTLLGLSFFYRGQSYSRAVVFLFIILDIVLISSSRISIRKALEFARKKGYNLRHVVIVGSGELARLLIKKINQHPGLGLEIVGVVNGEHHELNEKELEVPILGPMTKLMDIYRQRSFDHIFVALSLEEQKKIIEIISAFESEPVTIKFVPDLMQFITLNAGLEDLDGLPIINMDATPMDGLNAVLKRVIDVVFSIILFIFLAPLMGLIAVFVKLTSPGNVLYKQERMGLDGKRFIMYKFRTMYQTNENSHPGWTVQNDPRTTRIGSLLRKLSLDELPQLYNVLKGEMSLVGPRPEQPWFVEMFSRQIPKYMLRHKVKSGITGWAQIHGLRGDSNIQKRVEYDLYYIRNWSLSLDIKILMLTLFRVTENAY